MIAAPPESHSFDELADYWLEKKAPRKRSGKDDQSIIRKHLRPYFGGLQIPSITTELVDQFIVDKDGEVSSPAVPRPGGAGLARGTLGSVNARLADLPQHLEGASCRSLMS